MCQGLVLQAGSLSMASMPGCLALPPCCPRAPHTCWVVPCAGHMLSGAQDGHLNTLLICSGARLLLPNRPVFLLTPWQPEAPTSSLGVPKDWLSRWQAAG